MKHFTEDGIEIEPTEDELIAEHFAALVDTYLSGGEAMAKYLSIGIKAMRFKDILIGQLFAFTHSPFGVIKLHKKETTTTAKREDGPMAQLYPNWWVGVYK